MFTFKKKNPLKVAEKDRLVSEARALTDKAIGAAQDCLKMEEFKRYKDQYIALKDILILQLYSIDDTETDPVVYGFKVKDVICKLRNIGSLLHGIENAARKK